MQVEHLTLGHVAGEYHADVGARGRVEARAREHGHLVDVLVAIVGQIGHADLLGVLDVQIAEVDGEYDVGAHAHEQRDEDGQVLERIGVGERVVEVDAGRQELHAAAELGQVSRRTVGRVDRGRGEHVRAGRLPIAVVVEPVAGGREDAQVELVREIERRVRVGAEVQARIVDRVAAVGRERDGRVERVGGVAVHGRVGRAVEAERGARVCGRVDAARAAGTPHPHLGRVELAYGETHHARSVRVHRGHVDEEHEEGLVVLEARVRRTKVAVQVVVDVGGVLVDARRRRIELEEREVADGHVGRALGQVQLNVQRRVVRGVHLVLEENLTAREVRARHVQRHGRLDAVRRLATDGERERRRQILHRDRLVRDRVVELELRRGRRVDAHYVVAVAARHRRVVR